MIVLTVVLYCTDKKQRNWMPYPWGRALGGSQGLFIKSKAFGVRAR